MSAFVKETHVGRLDERMHSMCAHAEARNRRGGGGLPEHFRFNPSAFYVMEENGVRTAAGRTCSTVRRISSGFSAPSSILAVSRYGSCLSLPSHCHRTAVGHRQRVSHAVTTP